MRTLRTVLLTSLCACAIVCVCTACASAAQPAVDLPESAHAALDAYPQADISGYKMAEGYTQESHYVDMTVQDVLHEMDAGATFVLLCSFADCPWCNHIITPLNDIAVENNLKIAYIDTRKDPSWDSNTDITDYDLFIERFGSMLSKDDTDTPHLYVPHIFFIKDGAIVYDHAGTVSSQEDPAIPFTGAQLNEFRALVYDGLNAMV